MRSSPLSTVRRRLSSTGLQNICDRTAVYRACGNAYCESSSFNCNYELIGRPAATLLGAMKDTRAVRARGAAPLSSNQAAKLMRLIRERPA